MYLEGVDELIVVPAVPDGLLDDGAEALLARRQVRLHQHDQLHHEVQLPKSKKDQFKEDKDYVVCIAHPAKYESHHLAFACYDMFIN